MATFHHVKLIILPRQARDKHIRKASTQSKTRFLADYKTSLLGRYTRAVTLAAWDRTQQRGFGMTVVRKPLLSFPYVCPEPGLAKLSCL